MSGGDVLRGSNISGASQFEHNSIKAAISPFPSLPETMVNLV